jgi:NADP-dependent 3-hydroxy acid dehydrogenase YdfG
MWDAGDVQLTLANASLYLEAFGHIVMARVMLSARKTDELEAAQAMLRERGVEVQWISADASRDDDIARLADETLAQFGHVDILVNNAGMAWGLPSATAQQLLGEIEPKSLRGFRPRYPT